METQSVNVLHSFTLAGNPPDNLGLRYTDCRPERQPVSVSAASRFVCLRYAGTAQIDMEEDTINTNGSPC